MSTTKLRSSIVAYFESAGVWVIEPRRKELPDLLLPEYGWIFVAGPGPLTEEQHAAFARAVAAGLLVSVARSVHEALLTVSCWQAEKMPKVRAKYLRVVK